MSAPLKVTLNPHELDDAKVKRMFRHGPDELLEHRSAFYRAGFDPLATTGRIKPMMDFVLLRAITNTEIDRVRGSSIMLAGNQDRLNEAQCFEIVDVGPVVQQLQRGRWWRALKQFLGLSPGSVTTLGRVGAGVSMVRIHYMHGSLDGLVPGNHCVSVASAADALDPEGDGVFQLVRACFIPAAWDPVGAAQDVVESLQSAHMRFLEDEEAIKAIAQKAQQRHAQQVEDDRRRQEERIAAWERGEPFEGEKPPEPAAEDAGPAAPTVIIPARHRSAR
jgi:hypothetical protein